MQFSEALIQMKTGRAVMIPNWGGYWMWSDTQQSIMMHLKDGSVMDIRQSCRMDYTLSFMCRDDWMVVDDIRDTLHYRKRRTFVPDVSEHESFDLPTQCLSAYVSGKNHRSLPDKAGPLQAAFYHLGTVSKNLTNIAKENN